MDYQAAQATAEAVPPVAVHAQADSVPRIILPAHLPAQCFDEAAQRYSVEPVVLVAIVKVESRGATSTIAWNTNGSADLGASGLNTKSWAAFFNQRYGISPDSLVNDVCLNVRAAAYALRWEWNQRACAGRDIWCAVARYHAPYNEEAQGRYVPKVKGALVEMLKTGRF